MSNEFQSSNTHRQTSPPWLTVLLTETRCLVRTLAMLTRNQIASPRPNVGRVVVFADLSRSLVYRETVLRHRPRTDLVLLAVRFRLRFIGMSRFWHFLFRVESLLNTLLFAAHPGFQTKLWLTDRATGYYRGIYEWQGRDAAIEYLETLRVVLTPWVERGSFACHVIEGQSRDDYLEGSTGQDFTDDHGAWWLAVGQTPSSVDR